MFEFESTSYTTYAYYNGPQVVSFTDQKGRLKVGVALDRDRFMYLPVNEAVLAKLENREITLKDVLFDVGGAFIDEADGSLDWSTVNGLDENDVPSEDSYLPEE